MSNSLQTWNVPLPVGSLPHYIHSVNQVPVLTAEEEQELAKRLYYENDLEAARRLVLAHLRFVVSIARSYSGYGLAQADLIQEGSIGLMKAVRRFNPEIGVRLVSFAVHWIKAEIHEFIIRNWRIVKIATTKAQRKLFFNLRKASKRLGWFSEEEVKAVAQDLNVSVKDVQLMEARLNSHDESFDPIPAVNDADDNFAPAHYLEDQRENPAELLESNQWANSREQNLQFALEHLDARSRDIIENRWLAEEKLTLHDLAAKYNVSAERIRQLENQALAKLKAAMVAEAV